MRSRFALTVVLAVLCVGPLFAQPSGPWPMFRGDAAHTGRTPAIGPVLPSTQWRVDLGAPSYASPAVGPDGTVYAASFEALVAVAPDGTERWRRPLDDYLVATPALTERFVFVGASDETVRAVDRATGAVAWTFPTDGEVWASPLIGPDGTLYVGSVGGWLYALDGASGAVRWSVRSRDSFYATPALRGGRLYAVDADGRGLVVEAATGALRATFDLPTEIVSSPVIDSDGTLFVGGVDGLLYAVDGGGVVRWTRDLGAEIIASPALGPDGTLYVGATDGRFHAVAADGTPRWTASLAGSVFSSATLDADGALFVGVADTVAVEGALVALAAADGAVRWRHEVAGPVWASPAPNADGALYVTTADETDGALYRVESTVLRLETGEDAVAGSPHTVRVSAPTSFQPTGGTLFYRLGGAREYVSVPMQRSGGPTSFSASIPAEAVTLRGLEYYVEMTDGASTASLPSSRPQVQPLVRRVRVASLELPRALPVRAYSMVSVPGELDDPSPAAVLEDDYGAPDPLTWRLFRWMDDRDGYREYPAVGADFEPGHAFFLVHRSGAPFTVENVRSVDTSRPVRLTLEPGWNQVGVPFAFAVDRDAVVVRDAPPSALGEIAFYDGREMIQDPAGFLPLEPWNGYFFRNTLDGPVEIAFLPRADGSDDRVPGLAAADDGPSYGLRLTARTLGREAVDSQNWLGLDARAADGADRLDWHEAPAPGDRLRLSLVGETGRLARDVRPLDEPGHTWRMELALPPASQRPQWIEVALDETGVRPEGHVLRVFDEARREAVAVVNGRLRVETGADGRRLALVLGTPDYVRVAMQGVDPAPAGSFLDPVAPNPFRNSTTVPFRLDAPTDVRLDVFDVLGRRVATLAEGPHPAGHHTVTWDGTAPDGQRLAGGVYFVRLEAGRQTATQTLTLLR